MKWAVIIVRSLVGLAFTAIGAMYFFVPMPEPPVTDPDHPMVRFGKVLTETPYMTVVKMLELIGGLLLLSGQYVPLGLTILTPILVNVMLFDLLLARQPGLGEVFLALTIFLIWAYRSHFAPVFARNANIGA